MVGSSSDMFGSGHLVSITHGVGVTRVSRRVRREWLGLLLLLVGTRPGSHGTKLSPSEVRQRIL